MVWVLRKGFKSKPSPPIPLTPPPFFLLDGFWGWPTSDMGWYTSRLNPVGPKLTSLIIGIPYSLSLRCCQNSPDYVHWGIHF